MRVDPGESIIYQGHPSWRGILSFYLKGVPVLFLFTGVHEDYHKPSDDPAKIDAEKESRIVKMLFWLGLEIANAPARPKWNEASYKDIVASAR